MDYDYRNRPASPHRPAIRGSYMYPRVGSAAPPAAGRGPPYHQPAPHASSGLGIRVVLKPEYSMNQPLQLAPQIADVPRCTFQFDFDFERKILAEAEKESPNWIRIVLENQSSKAVPSPTVRWVEMSGAYMLRDGLHLQRSYQSLLQGERMVQFYAILWLKLFTWITFSTLLKLLLMYLKR